MKTILETLKKFASGKTVLILFLLTMSIYAIMLVVTIPMVKSYAPDMALFDLSPTGYSYEHATSLLEELGSEGRQIYLTRQLPLDFIYPGLFAASYTLLLLWLFRKGFNENAKIFYLALTPVLGGLFDYLENICIIVMLNTFPSTSVTLVSISSAFTLLKGIFTTIFFILLFVGIGAALQKKLKKNKLANSLKEDLQRA